MAQSLSILAVTNIYPTPTRPTLGVFVEQQIQGLKEIGLQVNVLYVNRAEQGMGEYFRMKGPLTAAVQEYRPTLLHVMYGGIMADRVTSWNPDIPKLLTFHGSDLLGENLSGYPRKWISRIGTFCSRRAAKRADGVVVVSARLRRALPRGLDDAKVRVIPCGIDLQRFRPLSQSECQQRLGWEPNRFHVLFASNNGDPVKRPELARAAMETLRTRGVPAELQLMQGVSNTEVPVWMNASQALLLTSLHEGSPTVVKEALACGLPVVSVDVGDVAERIEGVDGCYIASAEPSDLADKLSSVCRARSRVEASEQIRNLSLCSIAHQLEGFYRETLSRAGRVTGQQSLPASISVPC